MPGPMPAPGEIPGAPGGRSQAQTAAGPQLHAAGRTELTGPGTAAPIALSQPGGGCRRAHLQGACTAAGRCHEVTAVRKAEHDTSRRKRKLADTYELQDGCGRSSTFENMDTMPEDAAQLRHTEPAPALPDRPPGSLPTSVGRFSSKTAAVMSSSIKFRNCSHESTSVQQFDC